MTNGPKRHRHISPTMDFAAKKVFHLQEFTAQFIRDILSLDVASVEILEGSQIHLKEFQEDNPFATAVDVRAKLSDGTEVIIEIQVQKQRHFIKRFHYYIANQVVENARSHRKQGHTHHMYEQLMPVYGIAILEKTVLSDFSWPVNIFEWRHDKTHDILPETNGDGKEQALGKLAFIELDKYNKSIEIRDEWRQWLEYFANDTFSKTPADIIEVADHMLDSSRLTKEERAMLDQHILRQEHPDMDIYSAREEGREEGIAQEKR